ncbi:MAG TPA: DoxX family protein [Candidatus Nitrosocosmicus sp.]|nr:DoxX family protein [Candidatus Nitrosocosmicus sp.]
MSQYGATILRLFLGVTFVMHAYLALVIYTPAGAAAFNAKMGIPLPEVAAWFTILAHGLGGLMMILGLWTRWAALANLPVMLGALVFVHLSQGYFLKGVLVGSAPQAAGYEYVLLIVGATLAQVLLGGGALAITRRS